MRRTGFRGILALLILALVIFSVGFTSVSKGVDGIRLADETSGDDSDSDSGPVDFA